VCIVQPRRAFRQSLGVKWEPSTQLCAARASVRCDSTPMRVDDSHGASVQLSSDGRSVLLYPRRKHADRGNAAVQQPQRGRKPIAIERSTFEAVFHMPQPDAAKQLGISLTSMKQVSRKLGLTKWPYRRQCKLASKGKGKGKSTAHADTAGVGMPRSTQPHMTQGDFEAANKALLTLWTAATFRKDVGTTLPVVAGVSSLPQALATALSQQSNVATQQDPSKLLPSLNEVRNPVKITTRAVYLLMCAAVHAVGTCRCRVTWGMEKVGLLQWLMHRSSS
jgi:hypothetical protein